MLKFRIFWLRNCGLFTSHFIFVSVEREGAAQRKFEEELRRKNMSPTFTGGVAMSSPSGGGALSTGMTTTRHVTSGSDDRGDYSEVLEEKRKFVYETVLCQIQISNSITDY